MDHWCSLVARCGRGLRCGFFIFLNKWILVVRAGCDWMRVGRGYSNAPGAGQQVLSELVAPAPSPQRAYAFLGTVRECALHAPLPCPPPPRFSAVVLHGPLSPLPMPCQHRLLARTLNLIAPPPAQTTLSLYVNAAIACVYIPSSPQRPSSFPRRYPYTRIICRQLLPPPPSPVPRPDD